MSFSKRLIQFDVDSTFITQEVIELLASRANVFDQVARITSAAMNGELDFSASLIARVGLLKDLPEVVINEVRSQVILTDGAQELVSQLHARGHCVSLVSGGFINVIQPLADQYKIDFVRANELEIINGKLTGKLVGAIIDRAAKAVALAEFAKMSGVDMKNTVAIGDGANDIDMLQAAGVSIAFNAKQVVVDIADFSITEPSLKSILSILDM